MTPEYNHRMVFVAACFGMLIFGIVMTVLGSVLPSVIVKFDIDKVDAGSLFVLLGMGLLAGSLIFGPLVDRFGFKVLLIVGAMVIITGFQGIAFAPSIELLYIALFFCGFAGGAINGGTNALVSDISDGKRSSRLTYLGVFFGIGAFGVPLLLGTLLDRFSYELLISGVGAMIFFPLVLFVIIRFPKPKHARGFPVAEGIGLTKEGTLLLLGTVLLLQSGLEMAMGGWSAAYFNEVLDVDSQQSVLFLSLFWMGLMLARGVLGYLLIRVPAEIIMRFSFGTGLTGSLIMLLGSHTVTGVVGLILTGIGFAAIFPVVLAYAGNLYAKLSGTAFSIIFVMSLVGGMSIPYIIGLIADVHGLRIGLLIIPVCITLAFLVFHLVDKRMELARKKGEKVTDYQAVAK